MVELVIVVRTPLAACERAPRLAFREKMHMTGYKHTLNHPLDLGNHAGRGVVHLRRFETEVSDLVAADRASGVRGREQSRDGPRLTGKNELGS